MRNKSKVSRRSFLQTGVVAPGAGLIGLGGINFFPSRVFGANDRVRVAVVGVRGRGFDHVRGFAHEPNAEVAAVCDIDESVLQRRLGDMDKLGLPKPQTYIDYRKLLEDKSIDAVSIATPNHWHSLIGIGACQAEKDVYIEKPCSHNWWEGRQLVRAANKYGRIVQHGTQSRSSDPIMEGIRKIQEGAIGDVYLARGLVLSWRDTIGHAPVAAVPPGVNYDLWTGPAPLKPFTRNRFHYNWHWIWDTGNGEVGNQGVHQVDVARWGLGVKFPTKVSAMGGHFMFDDDQQTPNVLNCAFEFDLPDGKRKMLEVEVRHWISNHEAGIGDPQFATAMTATASFGDTQAAAVKKAQPQRTVGNIFYGSKGYLAMDGYASYKMWLGEDHQPGSDSSATTGAGQNHHFANFLTGVRSRNKNGLNAPIEEGHISCTLIHLANASYRLGRTLNFDAASESVIGDDEANNLLRDGPRGYRAPYTVPDDV